MPEGVVKRLDDSNSIKYLPIRNNSRVIKPNKARVVGVGPAGGASLQNIDQRKIIMTDSCEKCGNESFFVADDIEGTKKNCGECGEKSDLIKDTPCQVDILELLLDVPADLSINWPSQFDEDGNETGSTHCPIGKQSHEAALLIKMLRQTCSTLKSDKESLNDQIEKQSIIDQSNSKFTEWLCRKIGKSMSTLAWEATNGGVLDPEDDRFLVTNLEIINFYRQMYCNDKTQVTEAIKKLLTMFVAVAELDQPIMTEVKVGVVDCEGKQHSTRVWASKGKTPVERAAELKDKLDQIEILADDLVDAAKSGHCCLSLNLAERIEKLCRS